MTRSSVIDEAVRKRQELEMMTVREYAAHRESEFARLRLLADFSRLTQQEGK